MSASFNDKNSDITTRLTEAKEIGEIFAIIRDVVPDWIISMSPRFSQDYEFFKNNWNRVCSISGSFPTQIILVKKIDTSIERNLAEILTRAGFCVRTIEHFMECKKCGDILPTKKVYDMLNTSKNVLIPTEWSEQCSVCID